MLARAFAARQGPGLGCASSQEKRTHFAGSRAFSEHLKTVGISHTWNAHPGVGHETLALRRAMGEENGTFDREYLRLPSARLRIRCSMAPMELINTTRQELTEAIDRLLSLIEATPDDRLNWRPSESSRSILEVGAHIANALSNIQTQMEGTPFPVPTSNEADAAFRQHDRLFSTRIQVTEEIVRCRDNYFLFLDGLEEADLNRMVTFPFGMGQGPIRAFIVAGPRHTYGHIAQIEYIQTIYGDHDWHYGF